MARSTPPSCRTRERPRAPVGLRSRSDRTRAKSRPQTARGLAGRPSRAAVGRTRGPTTHRHVRDRAMLRAGPVRPSRRSLAVAVCGGPESSAACSARWPAARPGTNPCAARSRLASRPARPTARLPESRRPRRHPASRACADSCTPAARRCPRTAPRPRRPGRRESARANCVASPAIRASCDLYHQVQRPGAEPYTSNHALDPLQSPAAELW